jgi:hypothetical protein
MDILKSPKEILLEQTTLSPQMMQAEMLVRGQVPQKLKTGGQPTTTMTLNIGKNVGANVNSLSDEEIIRALEDRGHKVKNIKTIPAQPNSPYGPFENTAVVTTKSNTRYPKEFLESLSQSLRQEAIPAHLHEQNTSIMGGPKTQGWGTFDPNFFTHQHQSTPQGNPQPGFLRQTAQQIGQALTPSYETQQALKKYAGAPTKMVGRALNVLPALGIQSDIERGNDFNATINAANLGTLAPKTFPLLSKFSGPLAIVQALLPNTDIASEEEEQAALEKARLGRLPTQLKQPQ